MQNIDLHMHTKFGDKSFCGLTELLEMAKKNNIKVISFTDHNTLMAYYELQKMYSSEEIERIYGVRIVVGVEVNSKIGDECNDFLVYNIKNLDEFQSWLTANTNQDKTASAQKEQLEHYKKAARELGLTFDEDIEITDSECWAGRLIAKSLSKYIEQNSKIIPKEELLDGTLFFMRHCCNPKSPFFFDISKYRPKVEDLILIAEKCGGMVFVAHPGAYHGKSKEDLLQYLKLSKSLGIKGIEIGNCFNGDNELFWNFPREFSVSEGLYQSAGTDIHTIDDRGYTRGNPNIKPRYIGVGAIQLPSGKIINPSANIEAWARYFVFHKKEIEINDDKGDFIH